MSQFKVGDVCVVISSPTNPHHVGLECTVMSDLRWFRSQETGEAILAHEVSSTQFERIEEPGLV
jgi:hypothetical protein